MNNYRPLSEMANIIPPQKGYFGSSYYGAMQPPVNTAQAPAGAMGQQPMAPMGGMQGVAPMGGTQDTNQMPIDQMPIDQMAPDQGIYPDMPIDGFPQEPTIPGVTPTISLYEFMQKMAPKRPS